MIMKYAYSSFALLLLSIVLLPVTLLAEDLSTITERITERSSIISPIKQKGLAGESNKAYLVPLATLSEKQRLAVVAENKDRAALYAIAASHSGVSVDAVEKQRAKQISQRSGKGIWLQDVSGNWYRK